MARPTPRVSGHQEGHLPFCQVTTDVIEINVFLQFELPYLGRTEMNVGGMRNECGIRG